MPASSISPVAIIVIDWLPIQEGGSMYSNHKPNTHLTQSDRFVLERMLMAGCSFKTIARELGRHPTTLSREVRRHRKFILVHAAITNDGVNHRTCVLRNLCGDKTCFSKCSRCQSHVCREYCKTHIPAHCEKLDRKPYVCNKCKDRSGCQRSHAYYTAQQSHTAYLRELSESRSGVRVSSEKLKTLDQLISPLLKNGQSLGHIFASHTDEIGVSRKTIYNYVESGALTAKNIDFPRKVRYRKRKKLSYRQKIDYRYRKGRTYQDFKDFLEEYPDTPVVEMDTVKGTREKGNVLLTMIFCKYSFMLIFLLSAPRQKCVLEVFDSLTKSLGIERFRTLFPVILTDNGCEFKGVESLEYTANGEPRTKMFYCDPQSAWQKPHIEKNHEFIRYVVPKGHPFDGWIQRDMTLLANHINSVARDSLGSSTPYEAAKVFLGKKMLDSLNLSPITPDEVLLKPVLLKH